LTSGGAPDLNYLLEGPEDAPVLVLSNSLGTSLEMWDDQAPVLRGRFRLLRYDTRGHGGSPAPPGPYAIEDLGLDVIRLLDRLGIERASFCGLSVGGMTGMWLAAEAPERVERLVLLCTSALLGPKSVWDERIATATGGAWPPSWTARSNAGSPRLPLGEPRSGREDGRHPARDDPEGYAGCCAAIRDGPPDRLPSIVAPTLVVSGAEDPATPPGHGRLIRDAIPARASRSSPRAAHIANVERPEKIIPSS
jgi:3-oxoadipate enol-lactonase